MESRPTANLARRRPTWFRAAGLVLSAWAFAVAYWYLLTDGGVFEDVPTWLKWAVGPLILIAPVLLASIWVRSPLERSGRVALAAFLAGVVITLQAAFLAAARECSTGAECPTAGQNFAVVTIFGTALFALEAVVCGASFWLIGAKLNRH